MDTSKLIQLLSRVMAESATLLHELTTQQARNVKSSPALPVPAPAPAPPANKKKKRARESDWINLITILTQDFEGMRTEEKMPRQALAFLERDNPHLNMKGSIGKQCSAHFNDLRTFVSDVSDDEMAIDIEDWFDGALDGHGPFNDAIWRPLLRDECWLTIEEVLGDEFLQKRKKQRRDEVKV